METPQIVEPMPLPTTPVPDWIHLLPAGPIRAMDGRGPYSLHDAAAVISRSMVAGKLAIDENHATDLAAPKGGAAPARGWIVALQQRSDGLWGRVEWTAGGRAIMQDRAYRGISPVIRHDKDGVILSIARASLTNTPNLIGLTALHSRQDAALSAEEIGIAKALGLAEGEYAAERTEDRFALHSARSTHGAAAAYAHVRQLLGLE